jgi:hypothetical protein
MLDAVATTSSRLSIEKKGKDVNPSPFLANENLCKATSPYFVFSSFMAPSFAGSPAFSPLVAPASGAGVAGDVGSAGAGAGGGGGGGAGSSFLPHPAKVTVSAKSVTPDKYTNFLPILGSPPFPSRVSFNLS